MLITGLVVEGKGLGRRLGYPTANLLPAATIPSGVYLVRVATPLGDFDGVLAQGNETEVHLLHFSGNLYGKELAVEVGERLSDMISWNTHEELQAKIERDILQANYVLRHRQGRGGDRPST
jgi:riboflavin kinase/FMN adenylyltransferase